MNTTTPITTNTKKPKKHPLRMPSVELVALADKETTGPVWCEVCRQGDYRGHSAGPFVVDSRTLAEVVQNFKSIDKRLAVDFEHASEMNPTEGSIPYDGAPAQGWIIDLEVRGTSLWALVDWLPKARELIRAKQYQFCSVAFRFGAKDPVSGRPIGCRMTSLALTNAPFVRDLAPVAAKDVALPSANALADGVPENVDDALALLADKDASGKPKWHAALVALTRESEELREEVARLTNKASKRKANMLALRDRIAELEHADVGQLVDEAIATHSLRKIARRLLRSRWPTARRSSRCTRASRPRRGICSTTSRPPGRTTRRSRPRSQSNGCPTFPSSSRSTSRKARAGRRRTSSRTTRSRAQPLASDESG